MGHIPELEAEADGWSKWVRPTQTKEGAAFRTICCDCGLAHDIRMKVDADGVEVKFARNERSTAQIRRRNKHHD